MAQGDLEGKTLGKYRLTRLLGRGGMGEVYLAEHSTLKNQVAVKILPASLARDEEMVTRFLREARSAASLRHPHIIGIHDVDQQDDINYFSMDYVEGRPLTELIASSGGLAEDEIIRISKQVLSALAEAHGAGIIHRDIKPDNVIMDTRGDAVVMDFGIAKALTGTKVTAVGSFVGTVHYASPEQGRGREVDARSDLYSWGVVMYEMATGRVPFEGQDSASVFYQHVHEVPTPPSRVAPAISPGLSAFILQLLEKEPGDRFESAQRALEGVERIQGRSGGTRLTRASRSGAASRAPSQGSQAQALLKEAQSLADRGGWAAAQALAEKALSLSPDLAGAKKLVERTRAEVARDERITQLTAEAESCVDEGYFEDAVEVIIELAGISREKESALAWLDEVQAKAEAAREVEKALQRGQALEAAGDLDGARDLYESLTSDGGGAPAVEQALERVARLIQAREFKEQARQLAKDMDLAQAQAKYKEALELNPGDYQAQAELSEVKKRLSRNQRAQALVEQAQSLLEQGRGQAALDALEQALGVVDDFGPALELKPRALELAEKEPKEEAAPQAPPPPPDSHQATRIVSPGEDMKGTRVASASPPSQPPPPPEPPVSSEPPPPPPDTQAAGPAGDASPAADHAPAQAKSGKTGLLVAVGGVVLAAVIGAGIWFGSQKEPAKPAPTPAPVARETAPAKEPLKADAKQQEAVGKIEAGRQALAAGDLDRANAAFRQALALVPNQPEALAGVEEVNKLRQEQKQMRAEKLLSQGMAYLRSDQLDQAQSAFEKALQEMPDQAGAKEGLQRVERRREVLEKQKQESQRIAQAKAEANRLVKQGSGFLRQGQLDQAQAAFEEALAASTDNQEARQGLEEVKRRKQEQAQAKAGAEQKTRARAQALEKVRQGQALLQQGQLDPAQSRFEEALALDSQVQGAAQGLESVKARRQELARQADEKQRAEAEKKAAEAQGQAELRLKQDQARLALSQAEELLNAGRYEEANSRFQQYLAVFPGDDAVKKKLAHSQNMLEQSKVGILVVGCRPVAEVYIDGRLAGKTPLILKNLAVGSKRVEVRAYGGRSQKTVVIKGLATSKLRFTLSGGVLAVNASPWATVYLDGKKLGNTPLKAAKQPLGLHRLSLKRQGYRDYEKEVTLYNKKVVRVKVRLRQQ